MVTFYSVPPDPPCTDISLNIATSMIILIRMERELYINFADTL